MAKKEVVNVFKIMATGGAATPAPPLGPVLGSKGINPGQFVQKFNAATQHVKGKIVGCVVTLYNDKSFDLEVKSSPASVLIREAAKGSGKPNTDKVGKITKADVKKIAEAKAADLNAASVEAAMRIVEGTARSMGITVVA